MIDVGFFDLVFILIVALIVIGPERMPEVARTVGKFMRFVRRLSNEARALWDDLEQADQPHTPYEYIETEAPRPKPKRKAAPKKASAKKPAKGKGAKK